MISKASERFVPVSEFIWKSWVTQPSESIWWSAVYIQPYNHPSKMRMAVTFAARTSSDQPCFLWWPVVSWIHLDFFGFIGCLVMFGRSGFRCYYQPNDLDWGSFATNTCQLIENPYQLKWFTMIQNLWSINCVEWIALSFSWFNSVESNVESVVCAVPWLM